MTSLALVCDLRGHLREALQIIDDAVQLADQSPGRVGHRYPVHVPRALILVGLDRLDESRATIQTGRQISEELGIRLPLTDYQVVGALERFMAGYWDDAIAEIEAGTDLATETGQGPRLALARSILSLIRLHRNDLPGAREAADAAVAEQAGPGPRRRTNWSAWAHALLLEAGGELAPALATLADCWDRCVSNGFAQEYPVIGADLVRLALAADDLDRAQQVAAAVTLVASHNEVPWIVGAALRCRGLIAGNAEILQAAVDSYARASRPLELALACEDAGREFARQGNVGRASQFLNRAITIHERLDSTRGLARADALLRAMGVRRTRQVTHSRAQSGWQSLTQSEWAVVDLVAEGLSNPQIGQRLFISRKTVQTHLTHVFAKLHITSRAQLAAEVTRHRAADTADGAARAQAKPSAPRGR